jgi:hypothetical protein
VKNKGTETSWLRPFSDSARGESLEKSLYPR